jgi:imidazolonepropionase-like amidohydrolase
MTRVLRSLAGAGALVLAAPGTPTHGSVVAPATSAQAALPADTIAPLAFVDVTTLPMSGDTLLEHQTVVVRNGRIFQAGPVAEVPIGADVVRIDGRGRFLMPGLTDMHTHLRYTDDLLLYAAYGITTVLNLGQPIDHPLVAMQEQLARGALLGPTVYASGIRIDGPRGEGPAASNFVRTAAAATAEVRRQRAQGYQLIKAYSFLPAEAYHAIIREAGRQHMAVVGHVPHAIGVLGVLAAGQRMIAHAEEYLIGPYAPPADSTGAPSTAVRREVDPTRIPLMVEATRKAGAYVCPTMFTQETIAAQWGRQAGRDSMLRQPEVAQVRPEWSDPWRTTPRYVTQTTDFRPRIAFQRELIAALFRAGVPLLTGTDSPGLPVMPPGSSLHQELEALHRSGVSVLGALRASTVNASDFVTSVIPGAPPFGVIEPGRRADLVLLAANPLTALTNTRQQVGVMLRGRWLSSARLRQKVDSQARSWRH